MKSKKDIVDRLNENLDHRYNYAGESNKETCSIAVDIFKWVLNEPHEMRSTREIQGRLRNSKKLFGRAIKDNVSTEIYENLHWKCHFLDWVENPEKV